jgi:hypothetical protein
LFGLSKSSVVDVVDVVVVVAIVVVAIVVVAAAGKGHFHKHRVINCYYFPAQSIGKYVVSVSVCVCAWC